jgi:hypothetical protein
MITRAGDDEPFGELMFLIGSGSSFERDLPILLQRTGMAGQTADQS